MYKHFEIHLNRFQETATTGVYKSISVKIRDSLHFYSVCGLTVDQLFFKTWHQRLVCVLNPTATYSQRMRLVTIKQTI